jgi:methionine synthase II (cobalamin-independent)
VYTNDEDYFGDIAKAYQAELKILYDAGCRNVQFDDPNLACKITQFVQTSNMKNIQTNLLQTSAPTSS